MKLRWRSKPVPVAESAVQALATKLGVDFPAKVAEFLRISGGGKLAAPCFDYVDPDIGKVGTAISVILRCSMRGTDSILGAVNDLEDRVPAGVVPFGKDGGGDYICLDLRKRGMCPVLYWAHEGDLLLPVAASLESFLERLREPAE